MALATEFIEIPLSELHREAAIMKADGWRFIQTCAANGEDGVDLYYSFMKDGLARNLKVVGVKGSDPVPSITDLFLAAFVFENEARELFGVDMRDIALDFQGAMYAPAENVPMTIITPEQKAAREKAAKAAAAKAAKAASASEEGNSENPASGKAKGKRIFVMTPERRARLDAKLATMSPEKVAKVEAALKAREAEAAAASSGAEAQAETQATSDAQASSAATDTAAGSDAPVTVPTKKDTQLEEKLKQMDPEKAAKVRAVLSGGAAPDVVSTGAGESYASDEPRDAELESKLSMMDSDKAAKVRAALASGRARNASSKGGE